MAELVSGAAVAEQAGGDRTVHVVGDAAYVGEHLRGLGGRLSWAGLNESSGRRRAVESCNTGAARRR
jgi:hypothetical protein